MADKILILEDDPGNADVMRLILIEEQFLVRCISRNALLEKALEGFQPDLLLMDVMLDGADGRLLCRELKRHATTRSIPVLLVTALLERELDNVESRADGVIFKPFDYSRLAQMVRNLLRSKGAVVH